MRERLYFEDWMPGRRMTLTPHRPADELGAGASPEAGFTLVEVILAIAIASGLLLVVLSFYRQAADLREQLLRETERLATVRLVMDRLTTELRSVRGGGAGQPALSGQSMSLTFIRTEVPSRTAWSGGQLGRAVGVETDLKRVRYVANGDATNTTSLVRTEEPLVQKQAIRRSEVAVPREDPAAKPPPPLTEELHFVRFRYFDGLDWTEEWDAGEPPQGVEVTLAVEPLPEGLLPEQYPFEVFQRVIQLPQSGSADDIFLSGLLEGGTGSGAEGETEAMEELFP
jgi:prepilin-type N-terminal cleavage/methylation domain-containing protein